jgi:hypothetical protein
MNTKRPLERGVLYLKNIDLSRGASINWLYVSNNCNFVSFLGTGLADGFDFKLTIN